MLARLMPLLLHAKAGAISGVVLIGATGALVGVSSQNVVTSVAAAPASASPSALSARHATPEPSESTERSSSPKPLSVTKAADACTSQTAVLGSQIQRVDSAFTLLRSDLMKLRGTRPESALERADASLKRIHQASILALRASLSCAKPDDQDEADSDTESDADTDTETETEADADTETETENGEENADDETVTPAWITFAATDPSVIADRAIAAMQAAVDAAKSAPAVPARPGRSPEPDRDRD